jgi:anaerobic magnesium-protoporphyrin IX monomethyl ester cyclase
MDPYVLLIHPLYGEETEKRIFHPGFEFPISLAYLSAYLEKRGIANDILDLRIEHYPIRALHERIDRKRPLAVGITASTAGIEQAALVAWQVKAIDPKIVTILGGWHASALPEGTLNKYPQFDCLIHGEGERAMVNLIACLEGGNSPVRLKSLAVRVKGTVQVNPREELITNLDEMPFPAREKLPILHYHPKPGTRNYLRLPSTGILVGRGCPYWCLFCYKGVWGTSVRLRSPENVLEELETCIDQFGIRDFRFYDDAITLPQWDMKTFCEAIISRRLDISWNCWSRVNDVNEDKLRLMKAAGCYHIKFGIEFGTEKALRLSKKGATLEQARRAVALTKKVGLECKGSFIFGIPGEILEDCQRTIAFALEISPDFATFYPFDLIPGSPYYEQVAQGKIDPKRDMLPRQITQNLSDKAYKAFYLRFAFAAQRLKNLVTHPKREGLMLLNGVIMAASYLLKKSANSIMNRVGNQKKPISETVHDSHFIRSRIDRFKAWLIRVIHFLIALFSLILTFPIMAVIGVLIRIDSPGPAIFKQIRIGENRRKGTNNGNSFSQDHRRKNLGGRPFTFYKFRTMVVDAKERFPEMYRYQYRSEEIKTLYFKIPDDPRLTRLGKRLRKTTLDELPNFYNLLKGDMSLVGPRPDIPEMIQYYQERHRKKFEVKPGITGLAQVDGRGLLSFSKTLEKDVEYVARKNLWLDLEIIAKTIRVTFFRIGAF